MKSHSKVRFQNHLVPFLLVVLLILSILDGFPGWRLLLVGLGGAWLVSFYWACMLAQHVSITRAMRFGWAQVGDKLEERFTLTNNHWIPCLWCEIVDTSDMPNYKPGRVTAVSGNSEYHWRTYGFCNRRGLFRLGPMSLRMADPFHFFKVELHYPRSVNLMVTPPVVPLPLIEVAPGGRAGEGRPRANAPEQTVSAAGVREFIPGDSLRWIHWRTTARRDNLFVRLFDNTPAGDWWIILDLDKEYQVGAGQESTEEHGIILAASLADRALRLGRAPGLIVNGNPLTWLSPKGGDGQRWEILRSLALTAPTNRSLAKLLIRLSPTLGRFTSVVIITPNVRGDWIEGLLPLLWRGAASTVLLLDPQAFGSEKSAQGILDLLIRSGIQHYSITPQLLDKPEAQPGRKGHWDWRTTPTGRTILTSSPQDRVWKEIS